LQNFYEISLFSQNSWISLRSDFFLENEILNPEYVYVKDPWCGVCIERIPRQAKLVPHGGINTPSMPPN
jgi:hypothetical protein